MFFRSVFLKRSLAKGRSDRRLHFYVMLATNKAASNHVPQQVVEVTEDLEIYLEIERVLEILRD